MVSVYGLLVVIGRGVGQVMFQRSALSGLLMLVGIFLNSWEMGVLAIGGNVASTLTAWLSGYKREEIRDGLYGFNGTLVGIAVGVFMRLSVVSVLLMAVGACASVAVLLSVGLQLGGMWLGVTTLTAPFVVAVWMVMGVRWLVSRWSGVV